MFKRLCVIIVAVMLIISGYFINSRPVFVEYSNNFEVYLNSASSSAQIANTKFGFFSVKNIRGESFKIDIEDFNIEDFLNDYSARIVFVEEIEQGVSYYAYSPKIKYRSKLFGQTINLHIFIGKQVTIGAPLIFGSF